MVNNTTTKFKSIIMMKMQTFGIIRSKIPRTLTKVSIRNTVTAYQVLKILTTVALKSMPNLLIISRWSSCQDLDWMIWIVIILSEVKINIWIIAITNMKFNLEKIITYFNKVFKSLECFRIRAQIIQVVFWKAVGWKFL